MSGSTYFLTPSHFSLCSSILSWVLWSSIGSLPWTLYQGDCLSPLSLSSFLECSSYSFSWNMFLYHLICSFYFCVFGRLVAFPDLREEAYCRRHPVHPSSKLPSCHWPTCSTGVLYVGRVVVCFGGLPTMGSLVGCEALPWAEAATTGWKGQFIRQLAVEPQVVPGLVLAHRWAEPGSGVGSCGPKFPELVSACWWFGPVPDTACCSFWGVPKLVLV